MPKLLEELKWIWSCFNELSRDRRVADGASMPLTTGEMLTYFTAYGLDDSFEFSEFAEQIIRIDNIWLEQLAARREATKPASPKANSSSRTKR